MERALISLVIAALPAAILPPAPEPAIANSASLPAAPPAAVGVFKKDIDGNGSDDLVILGSNGAERILLSETDAGGFTVFVDANNDGDFTDDGDVNAQLIGAVEVIQVLAGGGNDTVEYVVDDFLDTKSHEFRIDLGSGNDTFRFIQGVADIVGDSNLSFSIAGGVGNDTLDVTTAFFADSVISFNVDLGVGNDTGTLRLTGSLTGSKLDATIALGVGTNNFTTKWEVIPGSACDARVRVEGGAGKDTVVLDAKRGASATQQFQYSADLGKNNDVFDLHMALSAFQIAGSADPQVFGRFRVAVLGGEGNDLLRVDRVVDGVTNNGTAQINGTFELALDGGLGDDTLSTQLGTATFTTPAPPLALDRIVRFRHSGGAGNDSIAMNWGDIAAFDSIYDVVANGGAGDDAFTVGVVSAGTPSLRDAGFLLFDGGAGANDTKTIVSNVAFRHRNFEQ